MERRPDAARASRTLTSSVLREGDRESDERETRVEENRVFIPVFSGCV